MLFGLARWNFLVFLSSSQFVAEFVVIILLGCLKVCVFFGVRELKDVDGLRWAVSAVLKNFVARKIMRLYHTFQLFNIRTQFIICHHTWINTSCLDCSHQIVLCLIFHHFLIESLRWILIFKHFNFLCCLTCRIHKLCDLLTSILNQKVLIIRIEDLPRVLIWRSSVDPVHDLVLHALQHFSILLKHFDFLCSHVGLLLVCQGGQLILKALHYELVFRILHLLSRLDCRHLRVLWVIERKEGVIVIDKRVFLLEFKVAVTN